MSKPTDIAGSETPDDSLPSSYIRETLLPSILSDRRFMFLEQLAMVLLALSLWLAVS